MKRTKYFKQSIEKQYIFCTFLNFYFKQTIRQVKETNIDLIIMTIEEQDIPHLLEIRLQKLEPFRYLCRIVFMLGFSPSGLGIHWIRSSCRLSWLGSRHQWPWPCPLGWPWPLRYTTWWFPRRSSFVWITVRHSNLYFCCFALKKWQFTSISFKRHQLAPISYDAITLHDDGEILCRYEHVHYLTKWTIF